MICGYDAARRKKCRCINDNGRVIGGCSIRPRRKSTNRTQTFGPYWGLASTRRRENIWGTSTTISLIPIRCRTSSAPAAPSSQTVSTIRSARITFQGSLLVDSLFPVGGRGIAASKSARPGGAATARGPSSTRYQAGHWRVRWRVFLDLGRDHWPARNFAPATRAESLRAIVERELDVTPHDLAGHAVFPERRLLVHRHREAATLESAIVLRSMQQSACLRFCCA
jgi:hypothetical protein